MTNLARFTIDADPSANRGYDVQPGATPALQLEGTPNAVVRQVTYQVHDVSEPDSPRATKDAPTLTLDNGAATGQSVDAATPGAVVDVTSGIPTIAGDGHLWGVRCLVNGGIDADGRVNEDYTFSRVLCLRSAFGVRKILAAERTEYSADTWSEAQNELVAALRKLQLPFPLLLGHNPQLLVGGMVPSAYGTVLDESGSPLRYDALGNMGSKGGTLGGAAGAARPQVSYSGSHRLITLDGTDDYAASNLAAAPWADLQQEGTLFLVLTPVAGSGVILTTMTSAVATDTGVMFFQSGTQNLDVLLATGTGSYLVSHSTSGGEMSTGNPHLVACRYQKGAADEFLLRIDRAEAVAKAMTGAPATGAPSATLQLGRWPGGTAFLNHVLNAAAFTPEFLSVGEMQDVECELTRAFAL